MREDFPNDYKKAFNLDTCYYCGKSVASVYGKKDSKGNWIYGHKNCLRGGELKNNITRQVISQPSHNLSACSALLEYKIMEATQDKVTRKEKKSIADKWYTTINEMKRHEDCWRRFDVDGLKKAYESIEKGE